MSVFRQYYNKLVTRRIIDESPFEFWTSVKELVTERNRLTIEEVRKLAETKLDWGNKQIRLAYLFSCFTGLRISDVRVISYDNIINGQLVFRPKKTPQKLVSIPILDDVYKIIEQIPKHPISNKIFWGLPSTSHAINIHLKEWAKIANLNNHRGITFHTSRHTFATIGLTYGIDLYTMKELLAHSKIEMTMVYGKIISQKKEEEILKFPRL